MQAAHSHSGGLFANRAAHHSAQLCQQKVLLILPEYLDRPKIQIFIKKIEPPPSIHMFSDLESQEYICEILIGCLLWWLFIYIWLVGYAVGLTIRLAAG